MRQWPFVVRWALFWFAFFCIYWRNWPMLYSWVYLSTSWIKGMPLCYKAAPGKYVLSVILQYPVWLHIDVVLTLYLGWLCYCHLICIWNFTRLLFWRWILSKINTIEVLTTSVRWVPITTAVSSDTRVSTTYLIIMLDIEVYCEFEECYLWGCNGM
jgi:hypothetical protein